MASLHVPNGEDKFHDSKSMTLTVLGCGQWFLSFLLLLSLCLVTREGTFLFVPLSAMARHNPKVELTYNFNRHTRYRNTLWHTLLDLRSLYLSFTCISRLRHSYPNNRLPSSTDTYEVHRVRKTSGVSKADTKCPQRIPTKSYDSAE